MLILIAILSYLIGSIPFSFFIGKLYKKNLYKVGTQNIGTANVWRATGRPEAAFLAFLGDAGKGIVALILAQNFGRENLLLSQTFASFFVVLGHNWPIFLKFKGGRGLATLAGILIYLNLKILFLTLLILFISILLIEFLNERKLEFTGTINEKIKKIFIILTSQVLGRMIGIFLSLIFVLIIWPETFKVLWPTVLLAGIKHFTRTKDFLRNYEKKVKD